MASFLNSTPGLKGYVKPSKEIKKNVLQALGGVLYDKFLGQHTGTVNLCTNSVFRPAPSGK
jgi:hypothetical protein